MGLFQKEHDRLVEQVKMLMAAHDLDGAGPHYEKELEEAAREVILATIEAVMELYELRLR